jgi:hypothetical protein
VLNIDLRLSINSGYRWSRASVFPHNYKNRMICVHGYARFAT